MAPIAPARETTRFERRAMGSPLRLTVTGAPSVAAGRAWQAVETEFEVAEEALSRFRESSDLTRLNRLAGDERPADVDRRLLRALIAAHRAQRITDGRFDPRVLGDLERLGYRGADQRGAGRPETPAAGCTDQWLTVDGRRSRVSLAAPVDLGGIGKGLALRWAWRHVHPLLIDSAGALLEAGGDLVAAGPSPDGGPWLIGVEDPRIENGSADPGAPGPLAVIGHEGGALATSSVAVNRWHSPDGRAVHHLIDPRTGEPGGEGLLAVTVAGLDPAWAEVWSKALFLGGARAIGAEARARGLTAWWVGEDGALEMTPGARQRTVWTATDR